MIRKKSTNENTEKSAAEIGVELSPDGRPILRGTLARPLWYQDPKQPDREYLQPQLIVTCPFCAKGKKPGRHYHGWDLSLAPDAIVHRGSHCLSDHPLLADGYYIGLDPAGRHCTAPGVVVVRPSSRRSNRGAVVE